MAPPPDDLDRKEWHRRLTADGWNPIATWDGNVAVTPADATKPEFVIFVHPTYRNRGIGTELLEHVVAYAGERDHDELHLDVSRDRRQTITVYENVGFAVTSTNVIDLGMTLPLEEPIVTAAQRPPAAGD